MKTIVMLHSLPTQSWFLIILNVVSYVTMILPLKFFIVAFVTQIYIQLMATGGLNLIR